MVKLYQTKLKKEKMATLLGVRIDNVSLEEIERKLDSFLVSGKQNMIFTPNPEMLVLAHRDVGFKEILNQSSLNICDGKGIQLFLPGTPRISGVDFLETLCKHAVQKNASLYLLGSGEMNVVSLAGEKLRERHKGLRILGANPGPTLDSNGEGESAGVVKDIQEKKPDILVVGFGHGKQERWIAANLQAFPSVSIAIGVGGAFDFIAGVVPRAPRRMRQFGVEWLWRFLLQPWRAKRIYTAVIIFPYLCLRNRSQNS